MEGLSSLPQNFPRPITKATIEETDYEYKEKLYDSDFDFYELGL